MPNIFKQAQEINEHPNRNNFDLSKKINASFKFGKLYPVYCQPVVPGDSFSIDTAFNIKAMPVVFPVQTKMRAHMHYFYVRNKNLWKNWENWISNLPNATQDLTPHPYVRRPDSEFKSGSLHDFLGVPTSCVSDVAPLSVLPLTVSPSRPLLQVFYRKSWVSSLVGSTFSDIEDASLCSWTFDEAFSYYSYCFLFSRPLTSPHIRVENELLRSYFSDQNEHPRVDIFTSDFIDIKFNSADVLDKIFTIDDNGFSYNEGVITISDEVFEYINSLFDNSSCVKVVLGYNIASGALLPSEYDFNALVGVSSGGFTEYSDLNIPLFSRDLHINALPYRAYESIFNAYYRNTVIDPLVVDGQVQYNKFIPYDGDGADSYKYELHNRNYELDFLTSALPSPQQGVAPMVGVTALGDITIEDENGITTAHADVTDEGFVTKVVLTSPAASVEHARTLMNLTASGFNINDFRNTNALQRFLETSIRKGYKYKDFIAGHFGVEPKYVELDMPEFIGGFSRDISVNTIVSSADTLALGDDPTVGNALGGYGGYVQLVGGSQHSVRHYCDDYGFIMGILCITPTPCYSQLLPKHMVAPDNFLNYYFSEFAQTSMQPIPYKEVAPIQSYLDSLVDPDKTLEDTFGYQRPNYDMVSAVDEVHGDFRGSLRNFVINRIFDTRPELGKKFIQIDSSEINDIFVDIDDRSDTFLGEIAFSVFAKRPVPRVVIPNLGK